MRILVLSFYYQPDLCAGSFRCTALVDQLLKKDKSCTIEVISTLPNRYASFEVEAPELEKKGRLTVHRISLPTHKSGMLDQVKAFYYFYKEAFKISRKKDYELVFATSSRLFTAFLGARISRVKKIPLYLDIRDIFVDTIKSVLPKKTSLILFPFLNIIERYTFSRVATVNLVSSGFLGYFKSRYPNLNYQFYTNGIDEEFISASSNKPIKNISKLNYKTILYAGNIGEGQGLHRIVPLLANKLGADYKIQVIGDGGRKQELVDSLKSNDVTNVELIPPVSREELIDYYHGADILFLHLNDYSAFKKVLPSKIFEYAAFNKPILAGVSGYAANFITENVTNSAVFTPCDVDQALMAVTKLSFSDTSRVEFTKEYSRSNIMNKMSSSILSLSKADEK